MIGELITGVRIALGSASVDTCPAADANGDGQVTVDENIRAVNHALNGCPGSRTAANDVPADGVVAFVSPGGKPLAFASAKGELLGVVNDNGAVTRVGRNRLVLAYAL